MHHRVGIMLTINVVTNKRHLSRVFMESNLRFLDTTVVCQLRMWSPTTHPSEFLRHRESGREWGVQVVLSVKTLQLRVKCLQVLSENTTELVFLRRKRETKNTQNSVLWKVVTCWAQAFGKWRAAIALLEMAERSNTMNLITYSEVISTCERGFAPGKKMVILLNQMERLCFFAQQEKRVGSQNGQNSQRRQKVFRVSQVEVKIR